MGKYKNINEKIRLGYEYESKNEITKACDVWLDAWEGIKEIFEEKKLKNIEALEPNLKRAEEIILIALDKKDVRDREDVFMRADEIYKGEIIWQRF